MAVSLFIEESYYDRERRPDPIFTESGGGLKIHRRFRQGL
jgi:hypothetical protein